MSEPMASSLTAALHPAPLRSGAMCRHVAGAACAVLVHRRPRQLQGGTANIAGHRSLMLGKWLGFPAIMNYGCGSPVVIVYLNLVNRSSSFTLTMIISNTSAIVVVNDCS